MCKFSRTDEKNCRYMTLSQAICIFCIYSNINILSFLLLCQNHCYLTCICSVWMNLDRHFFNNFFLRTHCKLLTIIKVQSYWPTKEFGDVRVSQSVTLIGPFCLVFWFVHSDCHLSQFVMGPQKSFNDVLDRNLPIFLTHTIIK